MKAKIFHSTIKMPNLIFNLLFLEWRGSETDNSISNRIIKNSFNDLVEVSIHQFHPRPSEAEVEKVEVVELRQGEQIEEVFAALQAIQPIVLTSGGQALLIEATVHEYGVCIHQQFFLIHSTLTQCLLL